MMQQMRKNIRYRNRLEKLIQTEINKETRRRKSMLWGQACDISPAFVDTGRGDRKQLVYLQPLDTRPDYYVLRIDSKEDIEADDYEWDQMLLGPIESEYGNVDELSDHKWVGDKYMGFDKYGDEEWKECTWPMLHWSGGSWGVIKNFGITTTNNA